MLSESSPYITIPPVQETWNWTSSTIGTQTGTTNTAIGYTAGYSTTGSGNVFIGYASGYSETGSNKLILVLMI